MGEAAVRAGRQEMLDLRIEQHLPRRHADLQAAEHLREPPVEDHQPLVDVEQAQALRHVVERRLEAAVLDGDMAVVAVGLLGHQLANAADMLADAALHRRQGAHQLGRLVVTMWHDLVVELAAGDRFGHLHRPVQRRHDHPRQHQRDHHGEHHGRRHRALGAVHRGFDQLADFPAKAVSVAGEDLDRRVEFAVESGKPRTQLRVVQRAEILLQQLEPGADFADLAAAPGRHRPFRGNVEIRHDVRQGCRQRRLRRQERFAIAPHLARTQLQIVHLDLQERVLRRAQIAQRQKRLIVDAGGEVTGPTLRVLRKDAETERDERQAQAADKKFQPEGHAVS